MNANAAWPKRAGKDRARLTLIRRASHGRQEGEWQLLYPLVSIMDVIMSVITIVSVLVKPWIDQVHA
jgi:hypothetical protein